MSNGNNAQIWVIGSLNMDLVTTTPRVPVGGETLTADSFATFPGGKGANQAVACARAARRQPAAVQKPDEEAYQDEATKVNVSMIGAVGKDTYGDLLVSALNNDGIDCGRIAKVDDTTGVAVILVEEQSGENRILITPGANGHMKSVQTSSLFVQGKPDLIVLQLEIPIDSVLDIIRQAKAAGVAVLLNPAPAVKLPDSALDGLAHLILNESEAAIFCDLDAPASEDELKGFLDAAFSALAAKGVLSIVITLGANGVAFGIRSASGTVRWQRLESHRVEKVVDTTAAGDTFVGYYAVGLAQTQAQTQSDGSLSPASNERLVALANKAAAVTVTRQGAMQSIPYRNEVSL